MRIALCDDDVQCGAQLCDLMNEYITSNTDKEIVFSIYKSAEELLNVVEKTENVPATSSVWYGIQIMGLGRVLKAGDPALKGLQAEAIKAEGSSVYKYVTAKSATKADADAQLQSVRKKFPESFVVEVKGSEVKRAK